jgi:ribonuclease HI
MLLVVRNNARKKSCCMENTENIPNESLEWRSVLDAVLNVDFRSALPGLDSLGVVAYTDGACLKNPGGPAGWSALFWATANQIDGSIAADAPCLERYGHIPRASTTTNNRAEIAAVLAVLCIAPPALPLKIHSDSEYTIKVANGEYQMKANPDLWQIYRQLLSYRRQPPTFEWVRGHAGQVHNERADELAGWGAFNNDQTAYEQWQNSQAPEAHNRPAPAAASSGELVALRVRAQRLKTLFDSIDGNSPRVTVQERKFVDDMVKRLQKNNFAPSEKQYNWLKGLAAKHKI